MSGQPQRTAYDEGNFDPQALYQQQQSFDLQFAQQQQFMQKQTQQSAIPQSMHSSYIDSDSQYFNQPSQASGRFGPPVQANQFQMQQQQQMGQKPQFQQNQMQQFNPQMSRSPMERDLSPLSQFSSKDGPGLPAGANQQEQLDIMAQQRYLQNQQSQMLYGTGLKQNEMARPPQHHQASPALPLQEGPIFGQGFQKAALLLANIQQLQAQQPQQSYQNLLEKQGSAPQTPQQQFNQQQNNSNAMALQQILSMNQNLNQYQQFIDQIEKQGIQSATPTTTVSQGHYNAQNFNQYSQMRPQTAQLQQPIVPQFGQTQPNQQLLNQTLGLPSVNASLLPSQSDLIRQPLQKPSYSDGLLEFQNNTQPTYNNYQMNQSRMNLEQTNPIAFTEQENTYKSYIKGGDTYSMSTKNSVPNQQITKEREIAYNPAIYTANITQSDNPSTRNVYPEPTQKGFTDDFQYEGYSQRSPAGTKLQNQYAYRKEEVSPRGSWMNSNIKSTTGLPQNEPLSYLNSYAGNNAQKFSEGANSPLRQSTNRGYTQPESSQYVNQQPNESSFNRNNNVQTYNQLNHSQNSSQIIQEGNLNSQHSQIIKQQNQYSPAGSSYRYEEQQYEVNSSLNYGKRNNAIGSQQAVNIDEIPIGGGKPKTFEQLLEENLRKMGQDPLPSSSDTHQNAEEDTDERPQKKEFLRRKSQKAPAAAQTKKYNYYVDNFDEVKKKETRSSSVVPERNAVGFKHGEETASQVYTKQNSESNQINPSNRSVSPLDHVTDRYSDNNTQQNDKAKNTAKKQFLTRGSGTAGGKSGHSNPKSKSKKGDKKKSANPLMSDDEYPNDYNFAAEQDNKSPKLNHPPLHLQQSYLSKQSALAVKREDDINRQSIQEFEQLEQECSKTIVAQKPRSPINPVASSVQQYSSKQGEGQRPVVNKRKKKLFDDSDSNNDDDDEYDAEIVQKNADEDKFQKNRADIQQKNTIESEEVPKSSVVKKFFYKEEATKTKPQPPKAGIDNNIMSEQLERAMKQKMGELDKAIETYNQQSESTQKLKREYETLLSKQRIEYRDFELKKKKEFEDIDRMKNEEIEKLKKERKQLEQRSKNMQLVNTSNKKEREEIDFLKKELQRVQEESKAKEGKQKSQIDRLSRQVEELKINNKELTDELKHVVDQVRVQQQNSRQTPSNNATQQPQQPQLQSSRYTFSSKGQEQVVQQQLPQQQPKSILKNKVEEQRPVSASQYYQFNNQNDNVDDEDDEQEQEDRDDVCDESEIKNDHNDQSSEHARNNEVYSDEHDEEENNVSFNKLNVKKDEKQQNMNHSVSHQQPQAPHTPTNNNDEEVEDYDMKFLMQYHNKTPQNMKVMEQIIGHDGKIQRVYENGKKEVIFNNGVKREVFPDGYTIVYFNNNDIKQTYPDSKVVYYFAEAKTTQTTFADGLQVFKFANNQVEKHFPDGTKEIIFPDGTIKCIFADGEEESIFPDGTIQRIEKNGVKAIEFANGQKDILFPDGTRIREYPDGRVRKTYPDGTTENSYRQI